MDINYQVAMLYIATFGRAPDSAGLDYWVNDSGLDLEEIAQSFFDQNETKQLYPQNISTNIFISNVYQNLFDREPDNEGLKYWENQLDSGKINRSHFILAVINGALGNDKILLENKTEVGLAFVNDGLNDINLAHNIIDKVTIYQNSVDDTINIINNIAKESLVGKAFEKYSYIDNDLSTLSNLDTYGVAELYSGHKWEDDTHTITYSFNATLPDEYSDKDSQNWEELNSTQKDAVHNIMDGLSNLLNVNFEEVPGNSGMIRYNLIDMDDRLAGYAYYPGPYNKDGDIFLSREVFNTEKDYQDLTPGTIGFEAIAHETGHALGLKHPFDDYPTLPKDLDDTNHTIMSYTDKNNIVPVFTQQSDGLSVSYKIIEPQFYSLYDVSALQAVYGANTTTNIGNDIYTLNYSDHKLYTIWDAGGNDTIDLSQNRGHDIIDMHDGTINSADYYTIDETISLYQTGVGESYYDDWIQQKIEDLYNDQELYEGENNLTIVTGVVIENLYTGNNADVVEDNETDNHIFTNGVDDEIYLGNGGYDYIDGGDGFDIVILNESYTDINVHQLENSHYLLEGDNFAADIVGIEEIYFSTDGIGYSPSDLSV